jgi:hypothetical protein
VPTNAQFAEYAKEISACDQPANLGVRSSIGGHKPQAIYFQLMRALANGLQAELSIRA